MTMNNEQPRFQPPAAEEANPIHQALQAYHVFIRPRWWLFLVLPVLFLLAAVFYVQSKKETFQATCRVYLQPEKVKVTNIQEVYDSGGGSRAEYIASQVKLVSSQDVLEKAFKELKLGETPEYLNNPNPLAAFAGGLNVAVERGTSFITISYIADTKDKAALIANTIANAYIASTYSRQSTVSGQGLEKLREQLKRIRDERERARKELNEFKEQNNLVTADGSYDLLGSQLSKLNESLIEAKAQESELQSSLQSLKDNPASAALLLPLITAGGEKGDSSGSMGAIRMLALQHEMMLPELLGKGYTDTHPSVKAHKEVAKTIDAAMQQEVANGIRSLELQLSRAQQRQKLIQEDIDRIKKEIFRIDATVGQYRILEDTCKTVEDSFRLVINRISELEITQATGNVEMTTTYISDKATPPVGRFAPQKTKICAIALLAGLALAAGISALLGALNNSLKGKEEIQEVLGQSLVEFGAIPKITEDEAEMLQSKNQHSALREAFRSIRISLNLSFATRDAKAFVVSSALPGEGKTFTAFNLARAFAQDNKRVLVMDLDLRKPRMHQLLMSLIGEKPTKGLANVIVGDATLKEVVRHIPECGLDVAFAGPVPPNSSELLGTRKLHDLLEEAKASYDLVIIDSSPIISVSDALLIAGQGVSLLLVTRLFKTTRPQMRTLGERLATVNMQLTGFLTNCVDIPSDAYGYYYQGYYHTYRSYGYYHTDSPGKGAPVAEDKKQD